jgi:predicted negative regulator of RcsB-dependent stress response
VRNLLSLVGLIVVVFLGLGYYLGWYQFAISKNTNGNTNISFDVNTNKIKDDASKGASRVGDMVDGLKKEPTGEKKDFVGPTQPSVGPTPTPPTAKAPLTGR